MEFRYMFMTAPNTIFAVDNRTIGNNNFSYFNTSVYELNKNRHAFKIAGYKTGRTSTRRFHGKAIL